MAPSQHRSIPGTCRADGAGRAGPRLGAGLAAGALLLLAAPRGAAQVPGPLFPVESYPTTKATEIALGDVDGDGALDIAVLGHGPSVTILRSDHQGGMIPGPTPSDVPTGYDGLAFALGDVDEDGDLDLVVSLTNSHGLAVIPGNGDGTFGASTHVPQTGTMRDVVLADLDGDGHLDYAVADSAANAVGVGHGFGDGGFAPPVPVPTGGAYPYALAVGDVDGASGPDLAVSHTVSDDIALLMNDGSGGFTVGERIAASDSPVALALCRLDDDETLDLVVVNAFPSPGAKNIELVAGHGDGSFAAPQYLPSSQLGGVANNVAVTDLDGDGDTDLAFTASGGFDQLYFLLQQPAGFPDPARSVRVGDGTVAIAAADLSGDGFADVAVATNLDQNVAVVLGDGGGSFVAPEAPVPNTGAVSAMLLADMNADSRPDLVFVHSGPVGHTLSVMLGDGAGGLLDPIQTQVVGNPDGSPDGIVVDDFNGNGVPDACILDSTGDRVQVLPGLGDGFFGPQQDSPSHFDPTGLRSGDLDGDGLPDLALIHRDTDEASVQLNLGDGHFGPPQVLAAGNAPVDLALSDLDGDGALDLVVAGSDSKDVTVFGGAGDGSFAVQQVLSLGLVKPVRLAVTDLDGDGLADLLVNVSGDACVTTKGVGDGTFQATGDVFPGNFRVVADVDLDGNLDLVGRSALPGLTVIAGLGGGHFGSVREFVVDGSLITTQVGVADFNGDSVPDVLLADTTKRILLGHLDPLWIDLKHGLAGQAGVPLLHGGGALTPGSPLTLAVSFARPDSLATLVVGTSEALAPFKGGTLVPAPTVLVFGLPLDGEGTLELGASWPAGLPSGLELFLQGWIADPAAPAGYSATNGVRATAP